MYDNENSIILMLKCGSNEYILKDCEPHELKVAIESLVIKGFHYSELVSGKLVNAINSLSDEGSDIKNLIQLN